MRLRLNQLEPPDRVRLRKDDWLAGVGVFLLVFTATLPVVLPFAVFNEPARALRISNGIAIVMLFITGYAFGRHAGHRPWMMALAMVVLGIVLVGTTIALGG